MIPPPVVLQAGRVAEFGTPAELSRDDGAAEGTAAGGGRGTYRAMLEECKSRGPRGGTVGPQALL
jgi:hypothetical protein